MLPLLYGKRIEKILCFCIWRIEKMTVDAQIGFSSRILWFIESACDKMAVKSYLPRSQLFCR